MDDSTRIHDFWAHWEHKPNPNQEFGRFRARVFEVARVLWDEYIKDKNSDVLRKRFALISGTACTPYIQFDQSGLRTLLNNTKTVFEVAEAIHYLLWTLEGLSENSFDRCCREIQKAFDFSPTVMIRLVRQGNTAMLYPTGARLLDAALVESNLIWLARYSDVLKPFETALKLYMAKDPKLYRDMLDNLRIALEQMLRAVLKNQCGSFATPGLFCDEARLRSG